MNGRYHIFCLLLCATFATELRGQGTLMTVAGTGVLGFSGDGGDARLAQVSVFAQAYGITDKEGILFFTDQGNHRIRRVERKTGIITTFAGNGGVGYSGDGGSAVLAEINRPYHLAFDWKGNLLFNDTATCRTRSITPSGIISYWGGTSCGHSGDGGPVSGAKIFNAALLAGDSGKLFLGTTGYIRFVDKSGVISRYAGTGYGFSGDGGPAIDAQMRGVIALAYDLAGNLIIADQGSLRVRHINKFLFINTIVGNGSTSISGDGGKGIAAGIGAIFGMACDQFGNIFISASNRIRKVDFKDSVITTIAGTGVAGYSGEGVDAKTHSITNSLIYFDTTYYELYFFDTARVRKITNLVKPVSIAETAKTYNPEIFPNPATTEIHVSGVPIRSEIWIYDLMGREQYHTIMQEMEQVIEVGTLSSGSYLLKARAPNGSESYTKWLKQ